MKTPLLCVSSLIAIVALLSFSYQPNAIIYDVPEEFKPDFVNHQIDPTIYTQILLGNEGTILHVPENAFVDEEGNVVETPVTIQFKEYKNAADMAFSKIPMNYNGDNFNSSGMFEIQGQSNGAPVKVASGKSLKIDYHLAKKNPDTDFYRLNERNKKWELVAKIPETARKVVKQQIVKETENINYYNNSLRNNIEPKARVDLNRINLNVDDKNYVAVDNGDRKSSTLLAEGINAGHTYPDIIKGLNVESFGVYNCDQIYRVPNRVSITASYQDEKGNPITDLKVLSLIDLDYNGAFSFSPENFSCNSTGNNVLLLFSESGTLYLLDKGEFGKMKIKADGAVTFSVKNVSHSIRNTTDLAKHLGIKV